MSTVISDSDAREIFSDNLRRVLDRIGWSQADLARELQVDDAALVNYRMRVSRWCSGKVLPTPADLVNISELTGCAIDELLKPSKKTA